MSTMRLAVVAVVGVLGVVSGERAPQAQEPAKRRMDPQVAGDKIRAEVQQLVGEARFGGMWYEWKNKVPRIKVGIVGGATETSAQGVRVTDRRAETAVMNLAAKYGAQNDLDIVPVPHTYAAIIACHAWLNPLAMEANKGAPRPMGAGIGLVPHRYEQVGSEPRWIGVSVTFPFKGATPAQRKVLAAAKARCGADMIGVEDGDIFATPPIGKPPRQEEAAAAMADPSAAPGCNITVCDPPLRGGPMMFTNYAKCTVGPIARDSLGTPYVITPGHCMISGGTSYWAMFQNGRSERHIIGHLSANTPHFSFGPKIREYEVPFVHERYSGL
jgi:hypothetical protein